MTQRRPGRPRGSKSWWKNPVNIIALHAQTFIEVCLATSPVRRDIRSVEIKRRLIEAAIKHLAAINPQGHRRFKLSMVEQVLKVVNRRAPSVTLRRRARNRR
jgi:hypothetical protein